MNYKGKVVDTSVAPLTSTGKECEDTKHFEFAPEDNSKTMYNYFTNEDDKGKGK